MFISAKANRISQNIVQQIRQAVLKGELKPGDRLPPEKELSERFGVSKSSLREAYRALEALGLLEVRQGVSGGAFICKVDIGTVRDGLVNYFFFQNPSISEYTLIRNLIEPEITRLAAQIITDEEIAYLENNLVAMRKEHNGEELAAELDSRFHKKLADIVKNSIVSLVVDSVQHSLWNIKLLVHADRKFYVNVCDAHEKIIAALRARDPEKAAQAMRKHISNVERGLINSKNGEVVLTEDGCLSTKNQ